MKRYSAIIAVCLIGFSVSCEKIKGLFEKVEPASDTTGVEGSVVIQQPQPAEPQTEKPVKMDGATAAVDVVGWSADSKYFAFGQRGERNDPLDIEDQGFGDYWLVDVAADEFVEEATISISYTEQQSIRPDHVDQARELFANKVAKYGVTDGASGEKLEIEELEKTQDTERAELQTGDGRKFILVMNKEFRESAYPVEGRFELVLVDKESENKVTLQEKGAFFGGRIDYDIHSAYIDPSGEWIAVITLKILQGFEGSRVPEFMVNTGKLP